MAWFGLAKMALQAGTHIYKKRQETLFYHPLDNDQ